MSPLRGALRRVLRGALRRLLVLAGLATVLLVGTAAPAAAHSALVSSSPGAGYAVTSAPATSS